MSKSPSWGGEVRQLRKKARLTQGQLIEQFSHLANELSEQERQALEEIDVYDEATTYFGGILDTPTLSRLEKGTRTLTLRQRAMAFVWGFQQLGVLPTVEEANQLLELGGHGNLTRAEVAALFEQNDVTAEERYIEEDVEGNVKAQAMDPIADPIADEQHREAQSAAEGRKMNVPFLLTAAILLVVAGLGFLLFQNFFANNPPDVTATGQTTQVETTTANATSEPVILVPATSLPVTITETVVETTTQTLLAESLTTQLGKTGNDQPVENIHIRDQDETDDDWNKFIKLIFTDDPYLGYRSYFLPTYIEPADVTSLTVEANYRGRGIDGQIWTWALYNWTSKNWEPIGNNDGAPWWQDWVLFSFTPSSTPTDFIHPVTREIQVQLQASDMSDSMDLDYEAIVIEFYKPMAR